MRLKSGLILVMFFFALGCQKDSEIIHSPEVKQSLHFREAPRPFKGIVHSVMVDEEDPPCDCGNYLAVSVAGTGQLTHLGRVISKSTACVKEFYFNDEGMIIGSDVDKVCVELEAANGDNLYLEIGPHQVLLNPDCACAEAQAEVVVVGGTGRFSDAEGVMELKLQIADGIYTESYQGVIVY